MSEYSATVRWSLDGGDFAANRYTRAHEWSFDGGLTVPASASPHIVPLPQSVADNVDPEEAFVASLSSCHMLFFLSLAAAEGLVVAAYEDKASGWLEKDANNRMAMTRVVLRPRAEYGNNTTPHPEALERLHHRAHKLCFIANSVRTNIVTEIVS
jgi:organic hydroperoxide reductase OsmC/OhrA